MQISSCAAPDAPSSGTPAHCRQRLHRAERPLHPRQVLVRPHRLGVPQLLLLQVGADYVHPVQALLRPDRLLLPQRRERLRPLVERPLEVLPHALPQPAQVPVELVPVAAARRVGGRQLLRVLLGQLQQHVAFASPPGRHQRVVADRCPRLGGPPRAPARPEPPPQRPVRAVRARLLLSPLPPAAVQGPRRRAMPAGPARPPPAPPGLPTATSPRGLGSPAATCSASGIPRKRASALIRRPLPNHRPAPRAQQSALDSPQQPIVRASYRSVPVPPPRRIGSPLADPRRNSPPPACQLDQSIVAQPLSRPGQSVGAN